MRCRSLIQRGHQNLRLSGGNIRRNVTTTTFIQPNNNRVMKSMVSSCITNMTSNTSSVQRVSRVSLNLSLNGYLQVLTGNFDDGR
jgi:hypothetical protein